MIGKLPDIGDSTDSLPESLFLKTVDKWIKTVDNCGELWRKGKKRSKMTDKGRNENHHIWGVRAESLQIY
jgi:hypothetical protein